MVPVGGSIIRTKLSYKGALTVIGILDIVPVQYMLSISIVYRTVKTRYGTYLLNKNEGKDLYLDLFAECVAT